MLINIIFGVTIIALSGFLSFMAIVNEIMPIMIPGAMGIAFGMLILMDGD